MAARIRYVIPTAFPHSSPRVREAHASQLPGVLRALSLAKLYTVAQTSLQRWSPGVENRPASAQKKSINSRTTAHGPRRSGSITRRYNYSTPSRSIPLYMYFPFHRLPLERKQTKCNDPYSPPPALFAPDLVLVYPRTQTTQMKNNAKGTHASEKDGVRVLVVKPGD